MNITHDIATRLPNGPWPTPLPEGGLFGVGDCLMACCSCARTVAGRLAVPILLCASVGSIRLGAVADANTRQTEIIGRLYPVIERDALEEIEAAVEATPFDPGVFGNEEEWSALASPELPRAEVARTRTLIPFFTLSFEIADAEGRVLYPKGYKFNPLEYLTLPSRLFVVDVPLLDWALEERTEGDMVLLSGGNPLAESRQRKTAIFKLEEQIRTRFDLQYVPSIIRQEGKSLFIEEVTPEPTAREEETEDNKEMNDG